MHAGDFHFLWECLRVVFAIFWGSPSTVGSLSNVREYIQRLRVDKSVKVFNTGDEFLLHTFKAHLTASICSVLKVSSCTDSIQHERTYLWLLNHWYPNYWCPQYNATQFYTLAEHLCILGSCTWICIRSENGPHIIRHWKWWLARFLGQVARTIHSRPSIFWQISQLISLATSRTLCHTIAL